MEDKNKNLEELKNLREEILNLLESGLGNKEREGLEKALVIINKYLNRNGKNA